jgi:glycosyltransferase involved in cell wall biosynthesis
MSGRLRVGVDLVWMGARAGGVGRYARELLAALAARGDVELHLFSGRDTPVDLRDAPWAPSVRWTSLPVGVEGPPLHLAATFAAIPALAAARRLDVLHGPANVVARAAPGVARVVTMHDAIWRRAGADWGPPAAIRAMDRWSAPSVRRADRVIADSAATADDLVALLGLDEERLDVVPLGVRAPDPGAPATSERELRERFALGDGPVILCVAQKRRYKRQDVLVRALAALDDPTVRLVLPGESTPFEAELRALAADLGVAERVHLVDWVSEADLEGLYALATCVALPSALEGFGLPVLEAMVRGVPVACSARSALGEVAGDAALTFDADDQAAVDAAVRRLLTDAALRDDLAVRGRAHAAAFTWERTTQGTVEAYRRAVRR